MALVARADLDAALGLPTVKALFDDDQDGVPDDSPIAACCAYSEAEVLAFLAGTYDIVVIPDPPPPILVFAGVDFGCAYAYRRRPEVAAAMNAKSWTDFRTAAESKMKLFATAQQRIMPPTAAGAPKNVGGPFFEDSQRIAADNADGTGDGF